VAAMSRPVSVPARVLSLIDVPATAFLLLVIFVLPTYSTESEGISASGQTASVTHTAGSSTLFAANPQVFSTVAVIAGLAVATLALTLVAAWRDSPPARWALVATLTPLTGITILALLSLGPFMLPLVAIGWTVFGLCAHQKGHAHVPTRAL
jgi:hypothetical protein